LLLGGGPDVAGAAGAALEILDEEVAREVGDANRRAPAGPAQAHGAELVLIHVVEGVRGQIHGSAAAEQQRQSDEAYLEQVAETLRQNGLNARAVLRFGDPAQQISQPLAAESLDLLVLGRHGHGFVTVSSVRPRVRSNMP
jgi:manganese transport protein